jgi:segregation and condensation protein A
MQGSLRFSFLLDKLKSKIEVVVTFLAILELIRMRKIVIIQSEIFGEIEMQRIEAEA